MIKPFVMSPAGTKAACIHFFAGYLPLKLSAESCEAEFANDLTSMELIFPSNYKNDLLDLRVPHSEH